MPQGANVQSIELLRELQTVLWKFREACVSSLNDVESDLRRTVIWLETEQDSYWKSQIRIRHEALERAKEALRSKKIFKDASGRPQSVVEEQKALKIAMARMAEAEQKLANVRKWVRALQKEIELYKSSVGRLSHSVESLVPAAVHQLDRLTTSLEAYVNLEIPQSAAHNSSDHAAGAGFANRAEVLTETSVPTTPAPMEVPTDQQRASAQPASSIDIPCPQISGDILDQLTIAAGQLPVDSHKTLVARSIVRAPMGFTLLRRSPADADDSGWMLLIDSADISSDAAWVKLSVESLPGDAALWNMILRLPINSSVRVMDGAVVQISHVE
ncbi:MAG: hypothetical protein ACP5O1_00190 [Phycisphaerae bacterium]